MPLTFLFRKMCVLLNLVIQIQTPSPACLSVDTCSLLVIKCVFTSLGKVVEYPHSSQVPSSFLVFIKPFCPQHCLSEQRSTNIFWKGTDGQQFRLCRPYSLCLHLRCHSTKAAVDNIQTNEPCCIPTKLYLRKQAADPIWCVGHSFPTCDLEGKRGPCNFTLG